MRVGPGSAGSGSSGRWHTLRAGPWIAPVPLPIVKMHQLLAVQPLPQLVVITAAGTGGDARN